MRRREFSILLGGAATAQRQAAPVIGFLSISTPGPSAPSVAALRLGLRETGYVEGQNLTIEYRWAEGLDDRLPALAADLVGRKVDVIVANGGRSVVHAVKSATSKIPIVFASGDAVGDGFVASLARPDRRDVATAVAALQQLAGSWIHAGLSGAVGGPQLGGLIGRSRTGWSQQTNSVLN